MEIPTHGVIVSAVIKNSKEEVLLIKNPRKGWTFPGGIVENGEDLITALKREIKEETGIVNVEIINLVGIYSNILSKPGYNGVETIPTKINIHFNCFSEDNNLKTSDESLEVKWVSVDNVLKLVTNEFCLLRLNDSIAFNGSIRYVSLSTSPLNIYLDTIIYKNKN